MLVEKYLGGRMGEESQSVRGYSLTITVGPRPEKVALKPCQPKLDTIYIHRSAFLWIRAKPSQHSRELCGRLFIWATGGREGRQ